MSSAHHDTPSRTWWSLSSKAPSASPGTQQYSSSPEKISRSQSKSSSSALSFTSFASAMGFKSKKQLPSLTIQEPHPRAPPVLPPADSAHTISYANRPPSKSVSSTRSRVDSIEPRTPLDGPRHGRQSLLTLSDIDPFAGRGIITVSAPHTPSDPNRLSAYSNSSVAEFPSKKGDVPLFNRTSYASSSSNSYNYGGELSPLSRTASPILPSDVSLPKKLRNKKSSVSLHGKKSVVTADASWQNESGKEYHISRPGNSSKHHDKNRSSQPELSPPPRPPMRARGMTDSGAERRPSLLSGNRPPSRPSSRPNSAHRTSSQKSPPPPVSPRVVIRQASMSRIGTPPSAPPTHGLPAPPGSPIDDGTVDNDSGIHLAGIASASSSSLSFASSLSSNREYVVPEPLHIVRQKDKRPPERSFFSSSTTDVDRERASVHRNNPSTSQSPPTSPRTLKKALSQSSLGKRALHQPPSLPSPPPERVPEKTPRKQRSFHHPRIPIPPIPLPLRHTSSFGAPSTSPPSDNGSISVVEQRRGSASSTHGRKRLFSGSSLRRPSTSQCTPVEDDNQSIFSLRSEPEQHMSSSLFKPWKSTQAAAPSSFWDEGAAETTPSSPVHSVQHEYTPQHIMSPAEMAKVEASMEISSPSLRPRGLSVLSISTVASEQESEWAPSSGLSPPPPTSWSGAKQRPAPSRASSLSAKSPGPPTARVGVRPSTAQPDLSPSSEQVVFRPSSSPPPTLASLPPPPRPRQRPTIITEPDRSSVVITPLPPPPRKPSRPKTSIEKTLHRQSLMRKPSFLDIDDETDRDTDLETTYEPLGGGSFLDFARESFDTVRSAD